VTAKKSFSIIVKVVFCLFSLYFLGDAFNRWDGYSFYMRFWEFLPELSLAFILWTALASLIAVSLCLMAYVAFKVIPQSLIPVRLEQLTFMLLFIPVAIVIFLVTKMFLSDVSISDLIGLSPAVIVAAGGLVAVVFFWFGRTFAEKILYELDSRITPLVWLFVVLLAGAAAVHVFNSKSSEHYSAPEKGAHFVELGKKRPNIILVILDALTAKDMQLYGYHLDTTPFISQWGKDAAVFRRAYASSNWTPPGTMSIMTGQRPWTHRVWHSVIHHPVRRYEESLPKVLRDNGYNVYGFVQNAFASPEVLGMKEAFMKSDRFDTFSVVKEGDNWWFQDLSKYFDDRLIVKQWIFGNNPLAQLMRSFHDRHNDTHTTIKPPDLVYDSFLEFISDKQAAGKGSKEQTHKSLSREPFFAWLHVLPPHEPYLPIEPYMGIFGDAEKFNSEKKQYSSFRFSQQYDVKRQEDVNILRKRYDEFILYSDQRFKVFLDKLSETIDTSNTIIVFSSDHGESFSDGWLAHTGPHLYESLVHIPLIIKVPGLPGSNVIDVPVEQIDIAPTVLEFAGIQIPRWMEGRSLIPFLEGRPIKPYPVFSMIFEKNRAFDPITKGTVAVRVGDYKIVYYLEDKKTLLFNTASDPDESLDLSKEKPELTDRLVKLIEEELSAKNKLTRQQISATAESPGGQ